MVLIRHVLLCILWYCVVLVISKRCSTKLRNGTIKIHCCDNRIEINGVCTECDVGSISDLGEPCYNCPHGSFGKKCAEICSCDEYERCNHVVGCVNFTTKSTLAIHEHTFASTTDPKTSEDKDDTFNTDLIINISCTVSVIVVILMCRLYTLYRRRNNMNSNGVNPNMTSYVQNIPENELLVENERIYHTIDEAQMIDIPTQNIAIECQGRERLSSSNLNSLPDNSDIRSADGYLISYQPAAVAFDHHTYCNKGALQDI